MGAKSQENATLVPPECAIFVLKYLDENIWLNPERWKAGEYSPLTKQLDQMLPTCFSLGSCNCVRWSFPVKISVFMKDSGDSMRWLWSNVLH